MLKEMLSRADGKPARITADQLQAVTLNNRNYAGELVRDDLLALCRAHPVVTTDAGPVDVAQACPVLGRWDLKADLDSAGEILFRQFWVGESDEPGKSNGASFAEPWKHRFDPQDPVNTPNTLDADDPRVQRAFGDAVRRLRAAGIPLDARPRDYQLRSDAPVAVHGGSHWEGVFNQMRTWFRPPKGYIVAHGSSFIMVVSLAGRCPDVRSILTYSQSSDPTSPYFSDQTEMFSSKQWIHAPFCPDEIRNDPGLSVTELRETFDTG
jgi:acyl-homoserine-lactone acylase